MLISTPLISPDSYAESIYKIIDKNGNISYTSTPPATKQTFKKIIVPPPPSDEDVHSAKKRHQQNLQTEKIYSHSRQEREHKIAEQARIRKEKQEQYTPPKHEKTKNEGPYYGIPGHGILVLPKGPRINR